MLVPKDPEDSKNAILEIRGGTGGDEAALFAGDLFRMYAKFCEKKGWKMEISSASEGASGGFKEIVCSVTGADVYGTLNTKAVCTAFNAFLQLKPKVECTLQRQRLPCFRKRKLSMWSSTKAK